MKLIKLNVSNFKSLKNVEIQFADFNVFAGPNGSGKSNFTSALDFISNIYSNGLEMAIARHGGYENISFRRAKRTKADLKFGISVSLSTSEMRMLMNRSISRSPKKKQIENMDFVVHHEFSIKTVKQSIKANFEVKHEEIRINLIDKEKNDEIYSLVRDREKISPTINEKARSRISYYDELVIDKTILEFYGQRRSISDQNLVLSEFNYYSPILTAFREYIANWSILQISSQIARNPGVPIPNPRITSHGDNLPAMIDWLKRNRPNNWNSVLVAMKSVLPTLEDITIDYLHTKTLGLFFKEEGVGVAWPSEDISDGTIQSLALFSAIFDPRITLITIEELENSIHPWIIRHFITTLRDISKNKTVVLTTHSPILLDMLFPKEVNIVSKREGATIIKNLLSYDESIEIMFNEGEIKVSKFLDMGLVPQAVPGGSL